MNQLSSNYWEILRTTWSGLEKGCSEWTTATACRRPKLANDAPACRNGEKAAADAVLLVRGVTARPRVPIVTSKPCAALAVVVAKESSING